MERAFRRDFDGLAREIRCTFARVHDQRRDRDTRRSEELRLAALFANELAGCGVAPKVARLALAGAPEVTQLIPIDSRWQGALREAGVNVTPADLTNETRYRVIEDAIVEAAHALGVRPCDADGVGFGWLFEEE
jgi:hypothetical protein